LTIKLTQCAYPFRIGIPSEQRERGISPMCRALLPVVRKKQKRIVLQAILPVSRMQAAPPYPFPDRDQRSLRIKASSPFHIALLEQILRFCASRASRPAKRNAYFLRLSKINPESYLFSGSPLPAERRFDLEPIRRIKLGTNKKPGVERRAIPSFLPAISWPSERKNSMLDSFYPVLVTNLTSGSARQSRLSAHTRPWQACADIRRLYRNPNFRQHLFTLS